MMHCCPGCYSDQLIDIDDDEEYGISVKCENCGHIWGEEFIVHCDDEEYNVLDDDGKQVWFPTEYG